MSRTGLAAGALGLALLSCVQAGRPSARPPGVAASRAPQFVCVGSDDNGLSGLEESGAAGGMHFLTSLFAGRRNPAGTGQAATFDGAPAHFSFYVNTRYLLPAEGEEAYGGRRPDDPALVARAWRDAVAAGHEIGVHTHSHPHGRDLPVDAWRGEMRRCIELLTGPAAGVPRDALTGFRTPYLEQSDRTLEAVAREGFAYDCSLEEGTQPDQDGRDFVWPYRLDHGSAAVASVGAHPGLWEIPVYVLVVPPDPECERLGVAPGLRRALQERRAYFPTGSGKITGMDWNLWCEFGMSPEEFLATLRWTLEQRLAGNRAPLTIGLHSELYSDASADTCPTPAAARRETLARFLDELQRQEAVRLVSHSELLTWLRNPAPLG